MGASLEAFFIAWNESFFTRETIFKNDFSISFPFTSVHSGETWILKNIYGPCRADASNIIGEGGNLNDMLALNGDINASPLVEIHVNGIDFTWSNMENAPLLEKIHSV